MRRIALCLAAALLALGLFGPADGSLESLPLREGSALRQPSSEVSPGLRAVGSAFLAGAALLVGALLLLVRGRCGRAPILVSLGLTAVAGAAIPLVDRDASWLPFGAGTWLLLTLLWGAPLGLLCVRDEAASAGREPEVHA